MFISEEMLRNAHAQHRTRVRAAKAIIDNKPPILHTGQFSRFSKLKTDAETLIKRNKNNAELLIHMNEIFRTRGATDSFRTRANTSPCIQNSTIPLRIKAIEKIEKENMILGKRILCTKAVLNTWPKLQQRSESKKKTPSALTQNILKKFACIDLPRDPLVLYKLLRPKIWLELEIKNVRPLGVIAIQLYTEAAPQLVLQIVRLCFNQQCEQLKFVRIFSSLWLEGQIILRDHTLLAPKLEYDKRSVDHGQQAGILSFSLDHMELCNNTLFSFALSFKPLALLNSRRVGFGRVVQGLRLLDIIEHYGTKNGQPIKNVIVTRCGILK